MIKIIKSENRKFYLRKTSLSIIAMSICSNCGNKFESRKNLTCSIRCSREYIKKLEELNGHFGISTTKTRIP